MRFVEEGGEEEVKEGCGGRKGGGRGGGKGGGLWRRDG